MANILDGSALAQRLKNALRHRLQEATSSGQTPPGLAVILVGDDPASSIYVANKEKACAATGILSFTHPLPHSVSQQQLITLIKELNHDDRIDGILVQMPLPAHLDANEIIQSIAPIKDVDGFHPYNLGRLAQRNPLLRPCTPAGIMDLLSLTQIPQQGLVVTIVGASNIVGRPLALEMLLAGCTTTICHRFTHDLSHHVRQADCVISAVGRPNLIKGAWIKPGAIVIDVGITRLDDGKLSGDVEFAAAAERADWITPVPGGVGPMTIAKLLENTVQAQELRRSRAQQLTEKS